MQRKNEGSVLVFSIVVLSLIALFSATCSALVFSNSKYSKYNYENIAIEELCLGSIDLFYANILEELQKSLEENKDFESFNAYLEQQEFINNISDVSIEGVNISCSVNREVNRFKSEEGIYYYRIISEYNDGEFLKRIIAFAKIKNPFEKQIEDLDIQEESIDETKEITENEIESLEGEQIKETTELGLKEEQDLSQNNEEAIKAEEEITIDINHKDLVEIFGYEEK